MQRIVQIRTIYVNDKALPCIDFWKDVYGFEGRHLLHPLSLYEKISTVVLEEFKSIQNPLVDTGYFWTGEPTVGHA